MNECVLVVCVGVGFFLVGGVGVCFPLFLLWLVVLFGFWCCFWKYSTFGVTRGAGDPSETHLRLHNTTS